jgi:glycosyltransferase involved in cell wall biosynthesis
VAGKPIVSLCLRGFPGVDRALASLSRTTGLTRHVTLASPDPASLEAKFLAEHLRDSRPPLVLFGGWSPLYARLVEALHAEPIALAAYWNSSPGQTDMSLEVEKLTSLLAERRIDHLLFTSRSFVDALAAAGHGHVHYLPQTLEVPEAGAETPTPPEGEPPAITLFCPAPEYRRKNVLNCLLALAGLPGGYRLLLNGLSRAPHYRAVLNALALPYEERGWMEDREYRAAVAGAGLGLQPSFAESYCYVAAEHLIRGVPAIGSRMVPVFERLSPDLRERLVVESPEAVSEIREKVRFFLDRPEARAELGRRARAELAMASARDIEAATDVLTALLDRGAARRREAR